MLGDRGFLGIRRISVEWRSRMEKGPRHNDRGLSSVNCWLAEETNSG